MTGLSWIGAQWMASGDLKAISPPLPLPRALYLASGAHAGLGSLNGAKLWEPTPIHTMAFFFEPWNSKSPRSGFVQRMPSLLSA